MDRPIIIVGAGRQGRSAAEIFERTATTGPLAGFLDDTKPPGSTVLGHPVLAGFSAMRDSSFVRDHVWIVCLGDILSRLSVCRLLADTSATFINAVHPTVQVSRTAFVGSGVFLSAFTNVGADATVEDWSIVDVHSHVGVDVHVGAASFVGPGCKLLGGSSLGARSFLGASTIVSNNVVVGVDCVVGANSLVLGNVPDGSSVAGTPARPMQFKRRPLIR